MAATKEGEASSSLPPDSAPPLQQQQQQKKEHRNRKLLSKSGTFKPFGDRIHSEARKLPISFNVADGKQNVKLELEKTVSLQPQRVRFTVGASVHANKKEISSYAKLECDVPETLRLNVPPVVNFLSSLKGNNSNGSKDGDVDGDDGDYVIRLKTFSPTIVLDTDGLECKKKFKILEKHALLAANVSASGGYSFSNRSPFFKFEALPMNPLLLAGGAVGLMKEKGKIDSKLNRNLTVSGTRTEVEIPVSLTKINEETKHRFEMKINEATLTMKLPETKIQFSSSKRGEVLTKS